MLSRLHIEAWMTSVGVLLVGGIGLVLVGLVLAQQMQQPAAITITPALTGQPENCLSCHQGIEPISASHSIEEFGCVSCHSGNRLALEETTAHTGLVRNPAALDTAAQYCGSCHGAQVVFVERSIMTTYTGAISLIRRAFGLQEDGAAQYAAQAVGDLPAFSPAESDPLPVHEFAENCQTCHIGTEPQHEEYYYRSTGCSACHVLYAADGLYQGGDPTISRTEPGHPQTHQITTAIPYTQCNHCHNRGNYDLRTMTFVPRPDMPDDTVSDADRRVHDYYQPISQFTRCEWELDCIDCHTQQEIMGNGVIYNNRSEARYVQCSTCHGTLDAPPLETVVTSADDLAMTRANLNALVSLSVGDTIMVTERGEPLYNIHRVGDEWILTGKATGETYVVPLVQGSACQQNPNDQSSASCHQCHAYNRDGPP